MLILCKKTNLDKNLPTEVGVIVHTGPPVRDVNNEEKIEMLIKDRMNILEDTSNNQIPKLSF